jgi:hypothetical protein
MRSQALSAALFLAHLTNATPIEAAFNQAQIAEVAARAHKVDSAFLAVNDCKGQSCVLADASGSTGKLPDMMPEGANEEDFKCVVKYNPAVGPLLADRERFPKVPKQDTGVSTDIFKYLNGLQRPSERKNGETDKGTYSGKCAPNILIFSKGTLEPTQ